MTHRNGYDYPRVKIREDIEAYNILAQEAAYYGKTVGEFIADLSITWTKMLKGESNPYWPVMFQPAGNGTQLPSPHFEATATSLEEARQRREAEEQEQRIRKEARLASARAELLDE